MISRSNSRFSRPGSAIPPDEDDAAPGLSIGDILAAVSAVPSDPHTKITLLEERIRRQWLTLQDLVREHAALVAAQKPQESRGEAATAQPLRADIVSFPPRAVTRSMVPPPRRIRDVG